MPPIESRRAPWCGLVLAALLGAAGCARKSSAEPSPASSVPAREPVAAASASAPTSTPADRGRALYGQYCALCHGPEAKGYAADNAPSLVTQTFLESASDAFIARSIRMGRPNTAMAAYGTSRGGPLSDAQIADIVAFVRSKGPAAKVLPAAPAHGDAQRGRAVYQQSCQACHGTEGARGNAVSLVNPEFLAAASDPFLRYAIANGRAPTSMPAFSGKLSDQQIEDVVTWLRSFAPKTESAPVQHTQVPSDLPLVINPKGARPAFTLREERFVGVEQVKRALDKKQRLVIIDARSPADWIQFHIPGSVPIPYHDFARLEQIPKDGTWVVAYCACPHHASGMVVDELRRRGYQNTAVLDEGILVWRQRGFPLAGEAVKP